MRAIQTACKNVNFKDIESLVNSLNKSVILVFEKNILGQKRDILECKSFIDNGALVYTVCENIFLMNICFFSPSCCKYELL